MRRVTPSLALALLTACGRDDPVARDAGSGAALPEPVNQVAPNPTGGPPANRIANMAGARPAAAAIPEALRGRWGLTPADCTSTRGDAKGLLEVGPNSLRFYESRAVPADKIESTANSISGEFDFTGEGEEWTRHQTLEFREDRLVRTERNPVASFRYVRC